MKPIKPYENPSIPPIERILPFIPEQGIDDFDLSASLGISQMLLRDALQKCPTVTYTDKCTVYKHKGRPYTIFTRIWTKS